MNIGLIAPRDNHDNLGCLFIRDGLERLVRNTLKPKSVFLLDMFSSVGWHDAGKCDLILIAGNPRYAMLHDVWWEKVYFGRIERLARAGKKIVDCFAGSAHEYPGEDLNSDATRLLKTNAATFRMHRNCRGVIVRDKLAAVVAGRSEATPSTYQACCSWHAPEYADAMHIGPYDEDFVFAIRRMPGNGWIVKTAIDRGYRILTMNQADYEFAIENGAKDKDIRHATTRTGLIHELAMASRVLTLRIHIAVAALKIGAPTALLRMDSRWLTLLPFAESKVATPFMEFREREPKFVLAREQTPKLHQSEKRFSETIREWIK